MKKIYLYFMLLLAFTACSDSFFDRYPNDKITEGTYYTNAASIEGLINNAYYNLRSLYVNYIQVVETASDNTYNQKFNNNYNLITINEMNTTLDNGTLLAMWDSSYTAINRCNLVLENVSKIPSITEKQKSSFTGQALFIRSMVYFDMVRIWGGVPLILTDIKSSAESFEKNVRATADAVYEQIEKDLNEAIPQLEAAGWPSTAAEFGHATAGAARTLLAKVYLTRKKYDESIAQLNAVIAYGKYQLLPDYKMIFDANNANNAEVIFAVQFARGFDPGMGNGLANNCLPNESYNLPGTLPITHIGGGAMLLTETALNTFEEGDTRRQTVDNSFVGKRTPYILTWKYYDMYMQSKFEAANDIIYLRYADVFLMLAEAKAQKGDTNGAFDAIKPVRDRAGLPSPESLKNDIKQSVLKERHTEFIAEGQRWFDLLRSGNVLEVMNAHFKSGLDHEQIGTSSLMKDFHVIFPIPKFEIDLSNGKLIQNPGY